MRGCFTGFGLECKKIRRTGFGPAFLAGGFLSAAFPVIQMVFRSEMYTALPAAPVKIMLDANWQMMAMLNLLLVVTGACLMYQTEYADHAMQKMCMLPVRESSLFFCKAVLMAGMCIIVFAMEAAAVIGSSICWFENTSPDSLLAETAKNFGCFFLLLIPAILVSLAIACACKNMWISLGIGIVCIFTATLLPADQFVLSLFPFALPFQIFSDLTETAARNYMLAGLAETVVISVAEILFLKIRRLSV